MNITETDLFKRAVEIAGWPTDSEGGTLRQVEAEDLWQWYTPPPAVSTDDFRDMEEALWACAEHFREWLVEHDGAPVIQEICGRWHYASPSIGVEADDYLECLCLAVVECGKKENLDGQTHD